MTPNNSCFCSGALDRNAFNSAEALFLNPLAKRRIRQRGHVRGCSIPLIAAALALFATLSHAQDADRYLKQRAYDYEQCANACQVQLDKKLFECMPYRKDKNKEVPEDCPETADDEYKRCMRSCPADPRPNQQ